MDRYEEAMNRMLQWEKEHPDGYDIDAMKSFVFPELKESEDERIRKCLLAHFSRYQPEEIFLHSITMGDIVAYLEKQKDEAQKQFNLGMQAGREEVMYEMEKEQKPSTPEDIAAAYQMGLAKGRNEQKPAEWSEEEKGILLGCISALQNSSHWLLADKLSSLRPQPKQEWSEEDDKMYNKLLDDMYYSDCMNVEDFTLAFREIRDWVTERMKNLRPQPHWKPSEEQMEALKWSMDAPEEVNNYVKQNLESLYNDLKKLM